MTLGSRFGSVAYAYERFRPGYPDAAVGAVLDYAERPVRTALEIGAGTGKATRAVTARGIAVTATDVDAAMLAELRQQVPNVAAAVHAPFEQLPSFAPFDLVFAAASLHWTEPTGRPARLARLARLLTPGGVFACIGGPPHLADADIERAVRDARAPFLPDDDMPPPATPEAAGMRWPGPELIESALFLDVRQLAVEQPDSAVRAGISGTADYDLRLPCAARRTDPPRAGRCRACRGQSKPKGLTLPAGYLPRREQRRLL